MAVFYANSIPEGTVRPLTSLGVGVGPLENRFAREIGLHAAAIVWMYSKISVEQLSQNRDGPGVPTCPGEWRIAMHILGVNPRAGIKQKLDRLFVAKRGGAVQRCLALGAAVAHEAAGFRGFPGGTVRVCAMSQQHLQYRLRRRRFAVHRAACRGASPVSSSGRLTSAPRSIRNLQSRQCPWKLAAINPRLSPSTSSAAPFASRNLIALTSP